MLSQDSTILSIHFQLKGLNVARNQDPTEAIRIAAGKFSNVAAGTACNQSSFKTGKNSFLFIGPGTRGVGFKAMFKLGKSMEQARRLASKEPDRFDAGNSGWVTARFTAEQPLQKTIWQKWLKESYELRTAASGVTVKKTARKKAVKKKPTDKKRPGTTKAAKKKK